MDSKRENIQFGESLLEGKTDEFKTEAIIRFTEFDRLMTLTNPDGNYHTLGYPVIVASLEGEYHYRQIQVQNKAAEAKQMMSQLNSVIGSL